MSKVNHPDHYGGADNPYEAIKVIEAWGLGFCLGNAVKYLSRAGKKAGASKQEDLAKARWYIERELERIENAAKFNPPPGYDTNKVPSEQTCPKCGNSPCYLHSKKGICPRCLLNEDTVNVDRRIRGKFHSVECDCGKC
jgi:hypothetical protein